MTRRTAISSNRYARACAIVALAALSQAAWSQSPRETAAFRGEAPVLGIYNWVHTSGDAEKAFHFYREILGIELAASPFAGNTSTEPGRIRPVSEAASDSLVWDLTDTQGSRYRTVFMRTANTPFGLELSEFFDIPRRSRSANPWDPGASILMFYVRKLDAVVAKLKASQAPFVTLGGMPLDTPAGRSILVRDPDSYLIQLIQASPAKMDDARWPDEVISTSIGISVADTRAALEFYRDLLGFEVRETRRVTTAELRLHGLSEGQLTQTATSIPGTEVTVLLSEFELHATASVPAEPIHWKIQDVGAPQFQLEVTGLDALLDRTRESGFRFLSVGARPIQRPFGRFVFAIDSDGVLVEFVEPAAQR